jgi:hypothetical protein
MAAITTTKELAIIRIQEKIKEAKIISTKLATQIGLAEYKKILNEADIWKISSGNTLKQIFSDEHLSSRFLDENDIVVPGNESLPEKISNLDDSINDDIKKLEHIINDLNNNLYSQQGDKETKLAKMGFWQTIIVALITAIAGIITGYIAIPHKIDPLQQQGLSKLTLEGKWKYICTSFDGSYQHGGRFTVQKEPDGSLILNGQRMWKDTQDTLTKAWTNKEFNEAEYMNWHTNWIFVRNKTQMNFEYYIPAQEKTGYCTGIINSENDKVVSVTGEFYVLKQTPILNGQITFKRVTDEDYNSKSTLTKNH